MDYVEEEFDLVQLLEKENKQLKFEIEFVIEFVIEFLLTRINKLENKLSKL